MSRWRSVSGAALSVVLAVVLFPAAAAAQKNIDPALAGKAKHAGWSRVIVTLKPGGEAGAEISKLGGRFGRKLDLINAMVVELPNGQIKKLAAHPAVARLDLDRPTNAQMSRVANLVGARYARRAYGYDGAGIGVAVIDSGVTNWHDDLTYQGANPLVRVVGNQRVAAFADFVNDGTLTYDDYGHGTHVAGVIAGSGYDSLGGHAGVAPGAHIISLKVLDAQGRGVISDVIAALEFAVTNRAAYNIRVINLSVGATVTTSYTSDPLTLAAKRAVDAGIVVVAAAGNMGRTASGAPQYGAITAPGNAPWVLTVGASSHGGTNNRLDDLHAPYSSRGPTAIDFAAKPDILAPGTGVVSLASAGSTFYQTKSAFLLNGAFLTSYKPYLSLSGTSMAAPVVSGTVALMLQANPNLTPNLVKAILQYTAQVMPGVDYMTQGGGFLNTKGAVDLAYYFATATPGTRYPSRPNWAKAFNWGNHRVSRGALSPLGSAWAASVEWGDSHTAEGDNVVWGTACPDGDCFNVVWGTAMAEGDNVVWGTSAEGDTVVWGTSCADPTCRNVVWGTSGDEYNVEWGTNGEGDNVVWGTACDGDDCFNVVWGTACEGDNCYNVVWGTAYDEAEGDNVVWGTDCDPLLQNCDGDNVVWGTLDCEATLSCEGDNVVWGTATFDPAEGDNVVWGTECDGLYETCAEGDNVVWGTSLTSYFNYFFSFLGLGDVVDEYSWQALFLPPMTSSSDPYYSFYPVLYSFVYFGGGF